MKILIGVAGEGERCKAGFRVTSIASSSFSSRINAASGRSPLSTLPPGNSHKPGQLLAFRPLRNQDAAIGINKRDRGNEQKAHQLR